MKTAKPGDTVTVVYDGILENGDLFESSQDTGPLEFQIGAGNVFAAFEEAVIGMEVNESKEILIQPEEAYGLRQEELVHTVPRSSWPENADVQPGVVVGMTMEKEGRQHQVPAMVTAVSGDMVTIDFNHPLAGNKVIYRITLRKIIPPENSPFPGNGSPS
ncbi:MAG: peptidylprolyl isomerase [Deltaproteobacteria bacterium]|nr:peptidylprolyl isomerase [Deltaproteobacteria bacterium]